MHISGVIVHASPTRVEQVKKSLLTVEGIEIHASSEEGKLVVTIEREDDRSAADAFEALNRLPGVLSATMVYHHFDPELEAE